MEDKEKIRKHISATRIWLDKAEDFLEKNNLIKAISNLFLASAEIQVPLRKNADVSFEPKEEVATKILPFKKAVVGFALAASFVLVIWVSGVLKFNYNPQTAKIQNKPKITNKQKNVAPVEEKVAKINNQQHFENTSAVNTQKKYEIKKISYGKYVNKNKSYTKKKYSKNYSLVEKTLKVNKITKSAPIKNSHNTDNNIRNIEPQTVKTDKANNNKNDISNLEVLDLMHIAEKTLKGKQ